MNRLNKLFFLLPFLLLAGCEDYLEDELLSETSATFLYSSPEGLESAVVGLYNLNRALYEDDEWNYARALTIPAKSDLVFGRSGEIALYAFMTWGRTVNDFGARRFDRFWRHHYRVVDRANAIIQATEALDWPEEDLAVRDQILAETRAMRAHNYFTLYRLFNNIFLTTEPTTPENALEVPQAPDSEAEIFALINGDLDYAIAHLEWTTEDFGRWTQASARHLRAKTAIWQRDWETAAEQSEAVINDENYSLVASTSEVFDGDMQHSEALFVLQMGDGTSIGSGPLNRIHFLLVPQYNRIDGAEFGPENGNRGAGQLLMNDYLRDLLAEDPADTRDERTYYLTHYIYNDPDNLPDSVQLGDTIRVYDQYDPDPNVHQQFYLTSTPATLKYLQEGSVPEEANSVSNIMVFRLAETYLIAAEARMEMGDNERALEYLNAVRTRAGAFEKTEIDQTVVMDERARELAFEGQRWFTIKRMGRLVEQIRNYAGNVNWRNAARERIEDHHVNWPIPESELLLLGPNYPQNEGYE